MVKQGEPTSRLGPLIRVLTALIDAMIFDDFQEWRVLGAVMTALNREERHPKGVNADRHERAMRQWGAVDQDGIYNVAGLTKKERQAAFLSYDRGLEPHEMAQLLGGEAVTYRVHLHNANRKLEKLGRQSEDLRA